MAKSNTNRLKKWWPALLIVGILFLIVVMLFQRWNINQLVSHPNPVKSYEEAVQRIKHIQANEGNLNPLCQTKFLTYQKKTKRTILLVHGYATCPQQFDELGKRFYALGYNVLIMPAPLHGFTDRMTHEQGNLKAEDIAAYTDTIVDIGQGLGEQVTIAGISMGGLAAAWAGQNRSDIDLAALISPGFNFQGIPSWAETAGQNIFLLLPVNFEWWNPPLKEKGGADYAYPIYSKHTLGEVLRFGSAVQSQAAQTGPRAKAILVITNGGDLAVDNDVTAQVVKDWQAHQANITTYQFPKALHLGHDIIDPNDSTGDIKIVYPKLVELISQ